MTAPGSVRLLTPAEVARLLRVSEQSVRNWIDSGALPATTLPHLPDQEKLVHRIHPDHLRAALVGAPLPPGFLED